MEQQPNLLTLEAVANLLTVGLPSAQSLINYGILSGQMRHGEMVVSYGDIVRFLREDQRHLLQDGGQSPDLGLVSVD